MVKTNLVLLAYGNEVEYKRAIFSLLSFWAYYDGDEDTLRITIYSDDPHYFDPYINHITVEYELLTPLLLVQMMGGTSYIHRRKIAVIDFTLKKYPEDNLLFVDADAFFISSPSAMLAALRKGVTFMHLKEYTFEQGLALFRSFGQDKEPMDFINFIESKPLKIGGMDVKADRNDYCWNSGLIASTNELSVYMPDVFRLTDDFYKNSSWFISEQLAFSIVLDRKTNIRPANDILLHYWGIRQKRLADRLLKDTLNQFKVQVATKIEIRTFCRRWKNEIESDLLVEQAVIALSTKNWLYGFRKAIQAILLNPSNIRLFKELKEMRSNN